MKKKLSLLLIVITLLSAFPVNTLAASSSSSKEIVSEEQVNAIDKLYLMREELASDYKKNAEKIAMIDKEILNLGAIEVSDKYVMSKNYSNSNVPSDRAELPTNYGVKWTSYRQRMNVNGSMFELQIITGVPNTADSPLLSHSLTFNKTPDASYQAICELVYSLAAAGAEKVPGVSKIITVAEIAKKAYNLVTVGNSETVYGVNCSANTAVTSTIRYGYVKFDGSADSRQIWMYMGNSSRCETDFTIGYNKRNTNGSYTATNLHQKVVYTIQSAGYTDYYTMCWNFYKYRTNGTVFEADHFVQYCTLNYKVKKNGTYTSITNGRIKLPVI